MEIWRKKQVVEVKIEDMDALQHDVRNGLIGLQLQRRLALQCIGQACKAFLKMDEHFTRIEQALIRQREQDE